MTTATYGARVWPACPRTGGTARPTSRTCVRLWGSDLAFNPLSSRSRPIRDSSIADWHTPGLASPDVGGESRGVINHEQEAHPGRDGRRSGGAERRLYQQWQY